MFLQHFRFGGITKLRALCPYRENSEISGMSVSFGSDLELDDDSTASLQVQLYLGETFP